MPFLDDTLSQPIKTRTLFTSSGHSERTIMLASTVENKHVPVPLFVRLMSKDVDFKSCSARLVVNLVFVFSYLLVLMMQKNVWEEYHAEEHVRALYINTEFNAAENLLLKDVISLDRLRLWIDNVYIPITFNNVTTREVTTSGFNKVISNPIIDMKRFDVLPCDQASSAIVRRCRKESSSGGFSDVSFIGPSTNRLYPVVKDDYFAVILCLPENKCFTHGTDVSNRDVFIQTLLPGIVPSITNQYPIANESDVRAVFNKLWADEWFSYNAAFYRFFIRFYNTNLDMHTTIKIVFAVTPGGHVVPFADIRAPYGTEHLGSIIQSRRFYIYERPIDKFRLFMEIVFVTMLLEQLRQYVVELKQLGKKKGSVALAMTDVWVLIDTVLFCLIFLSIASHFAILAELWSADVDRNSYTPLSVDNISAAYAVSFTVNTLAIIMFNLRLFKFFRYDSRFAFLTETLGRAASSLAKFCVIFFLVMMGYALSGYYFFGHALFEFQTFFRAWTTCFRILTGGLPYTLVRQHGADSSQGVIPPVWYWSFMFLMLFLLMNMFMAIVMTAYEATLADAQEEELLEKKAPTFSKSSWGRFKANAIFIVRAMIPFWDPVKHIPDFMYLHCLQTEGIVEEIREFSVGTVTVRSTINGSVAITLRIHDHEFERFARSTTTKRLGRRDANGNLNPMNRFKIYLRLPDDAQVRERFDPSFGQVTWGAAQSGEMMYKSVDSSLRMNLDGKNEGGATQGQDGINEAMGDTKRQDIITVSFLPYASGGGQLAMDLGDLFHPFRFVRDWSKAAAIVHAEETGQPKPPDSYLRCRDVKLLVAGCFNPTGSDQQLYRYRLNLTHAGNLCISTMIDSHTIGHYERMNCVYNTDIWPHMLASVSDWTDVILRAQPEIGHDRAQVLAEEVVADFGKEIDANDSEEEDVVMDNYLARRRCLGQVYRLVRDVHHADTAEKAKALSDGIRGKLGDLERLLDELAGIGGRRRGGDHGRPTSAGVGKRMGGTGW